MSSTIEYDTLHIPCPQCGVMCEVTVINEYNTQKGTYGTSVSGHQLCDSCDYRFTDENLEDFD